jgi:hypothetical protein
VSIPPELSAVLPSDTARTWETIAPAVPKSAHLGGGTALAVHLHHRQSRDLDFFFDDPALDLDALARGLRDLGRFAVTSRAVDTLNGLFSETRVQFLGAAGQTNLEPPVMVAGIQVLGLSDIMAMKVKAIGDRGELRDYFDLKRIEQLTGRTFEEGLGLYMSRYGVTAEDTSIMHIVNSLGYLDDVDEDELLPERKREIARYWVSRQREVLRSLSRYGRVPKET